MDRDVDTTRVATSNDSSTGGVELLQIVGIEDGLVE